MNISSAREKAGITQIELAKRLKVTQGAVSQWETGQSNPKTRMLPALAAALGCTVDELLRGGGEEE